MDVDRILVNVRGVVSGARAASFGTRATDGARVRVDIRAGDGWTRLAGAVLAVSQTALLRPPEDDLVFNLPIDVTYETHTPFGWPQLVLTVYGFNSWGVEAVLGYGRAHVPTTHGERSLSIPLFAPKPLTPYASFLSWFTGKVPELIDPDILAEGKDNHLIRTTSCGHAHVTLSLITKGFKEMEYDNVPGIDQNRFMPIDEEF